MKTDDAVAGSGLAGDTGCRPAGPAAQRAASGRLYRHHRRRHRRKRGGAADDGRAWTATATAPSTPTGTLTRAQFCKMAVEAMGNGDRGGPATRNYTIFPDVKSSHWAAGYINRGRQALPPAARRGTA